MPDANLAELYGVETRRPYEQMRLNIERFPEDFMLRLRPTKNPTNSNAKSPIVELINAIRQLMTPSASKQKGAPSK
jgi:hypothetical protein